MQLGEKLDCDYHQLSDLQRISVDAGHFSLTPGAISGIVESKACTFGNAASDLANTGTQTAQLLTLAGALILAGGLVIGLRLCARQQRGWPRSSATSHLSVVI